MNLMLKNPLFNWYYFTILGEQRALSTMHFLNCDFAVLFWYSFLVFCIDATTSEFHQEIISVCYLGNWKIILVTKENLFLIFVHTAS